MKNMFLNKKIAIVYDWLDKWGGVERILLVFHEIFPEADFFTSYYDKNGAYWVKDINIRTSFLQNFPNFIKKNRVLSFVFYPYAFESFNYSDYDLVISVTSSFAKGIITKTTPFGEIKEPINPILLSLNAGASMVARGWAGDQGNLCALQHSRFCQGVAHFS